MRHTAVLLFVILGLALSIKMETAHKRRPLRGQRFATITGLDFPGGDRGTVPCYSMSDAYATMKRENDGKTIVVYGIDAQLCWLKVLGQGNAGGRIQPNRVNIFPTMGPVLGRWRRINRAVLNGYDFPGGDIRYYPGAAKSFAEARKYAEKWSNSFIAVIWAPSSGDIWVKDLVLSQPAINSDRVSFIHGYMSP